MKQIKVDLGGVWEKVRHELGHAGIDFECCDVDAGGGEGKSAPVKVICVAHGLKESVDAMSRSPRDQVVMVRVDEETSKSLDAWVETGAVKSRSEAAALFIREGLKVRAKELEQLNGALREVDEAKRRLKDQARQVFGGDAD
jgi:Arc/MetJ-type ribon-helix-helix transcriptional regulator